MKRQWWKDNLPGVEFAVQTPKIISLSCPHLIFSGFQAPNISVER
jgi:hypothetical protein